MADEEAGHSLSDTTVTAAHEAPLPTLPRLSLAGLTTRPEFELGAALGEGGMGIVRTATQVALGRQVAIKGVKQGAPGHAEAALLHEARITGALEHPNIVPVYALGVDAAGSPLLVMKRVEGLSWRELIDDPSLIAPGQDALERHLEILRHVCQALEFAHSRRVVHRDLKPENVMIGSFGEVVVLDWGIAVRLTESASEAAEAPPLAAGSPAYMAPEMALHEAVDARTDVYLLGAVLHEVLTGRPPHAGETLSEVLVAAARAEAPRFSGTVPEELAAICRRALARDREQRFQSAAELAEAIADYLRHRAARVLAAEARLRLGALRQLLASEMPRAVEVANLAGECRFGFEQALRMWPESPEARAGLAEANALLAAREAELGRLQALKKDLDLDASASRTRARQGFILLNGVVWTALPTGLAIAYHGWGFEIPAEAYFAGALIFFGLLSLGVGLFRAELLDNSANRRIVGLFFVSALGSTLHRLVALVRGVPAHEAVIYESLIFAVAATLGATTIDKRLAWPAVVYALAVLATLLLPEHVYEIIAVANLFGLVGVALAWGHMRRQCLRD